MYLPQRFFAARAEGNKSPKQPGPAPAVVHALLTSGTRRPQCRWGMLGPSGKPFQSVIRGCRHARCLRFCSAHTNRIFGEGFLLCHQPIGWLSEIQFLAVGDVLDPIRSGFLIAIYFLKVV